MANVSIKFLTREKGKAASVAKNGNRCKGNSSSPLYLRTQPPRLKIPLVLRISWVLEKSGWKIMALMIPCLGVHVRARDQKTYHGNRFDYVAITR